MTHVATAPVHPDIPGDEPTPTRPAVAAMRQFRLVPTPRNALYSVDGGPFTQITSGAAVIDVAPGGHAVTFRHPLCDDALYEIAASAPGGDVPLRLKWKPARLVARCRAASAIVVNGRPVDNNVPIDVFEFDPRTGRAPHVVEFQIAGQTQTKEIAVTAGDTLVEVTCD